MEGGKNKMNPILLMMDIPKKGHSIMNINYEGGDVGGYSKMYRYKW